MRIVQIVTGLFLIISQYNFAQSAKILIVGVSPSYSHQVNFHLIANELLKKGHDVTYINPFSIDTFPLKSLRNIDVSNEIKRAKHWMLQHFNDAEEHKTFARFFKQYPKFFEGIMNNTNVQDLLHFKYGTFDLVIAEVIWPLSFAFKEVFNCPLIALSTHELGTFGRAVFGETTHPILDPDLFFFPDPALTLSLKISSVWHSLVNGPMVPYNSIGKSQMQKYFPKVVKSIADIGSEAELVFYITIPEIMVVSSNFPNFIPLEHLNIPDDSQLPKDLKEFLDESKDGAIYMSFGSVQNVSTLEPTLQKNIFWALKQLSPLNVVINGNFQLHSNNPLPGNLKFVDWIPQQAVLQHPNVKLIFSHGGMNSVAEAIYYSVPLVTMPMFGDHFRIASMVQSKEIGLMLNKESATGDEIVKAIKTVLSEKKYKENVMALSKLSRDKPMPSLSKAVWWIEYVLRNKGNPLYKPRRLPYYQYYLLDIFAILVISILALLLAAVVFCKILGKLIFSRFKLKQS